MVDLGPCGEFCYPVCITFNRMIVRPASTGAVVLAEEKLNDIKCEAKLFKAYRIVTVEPVCGKIRSTPPATLGIGAKALIS